MTEIELITQLKSIYSNSKKLASDKAKEALDLCIKNEVFIDSFRNWKTTDFVSSNSKFSDFEKENANYLDVNDRNKEIFAQKHPNITDIFEKRYLQDEQGKVYSLYSPNFKYIIEISLPLERREKGRKNQNDFCDRVLIKNYLSQLTPFDKEYSRLTNTRPYNTYWHHDSVYGRMILVAGDDHLQKQKNGMYSGLNVKHYGGFKLWKKYHLSSR